MIGSLGNHAISPLHLMANGMHKLRGLTHNAGDARLHVVHTQLKLGDQREDAALDELRDLFHASRQAAEGYEHDRYHECLDQQSDGYHDGKQRHYPIGHDVTPTLRFAFLAPTKFDAVTRGQDSGRQAYEQLTVGCEFFLFCDFGG